MSWTLVKRALATGMLAVGVAGGCGSGQPAVSTPVARVAVLSAAVARAPEVEAAQPRHDDAVVQAPVFAQATRKRTRWGEVYVPAGFSLDHGVYDLVIHFHGAFQTMEPAFQASGVRAVLFTMNLGNGSGPYEDRFRDAASFPALIEAVQGAVDAALGQQATMGRLALSSWSAGYGAVAKILARATNAALVDTVLLADSMHASLLDQRARTIYDASLMPFTRFAEQAADGQKLMAIAHSSIATTTYASTTETARRLEDELGVQREPPCETSPEGMTMVSCADKGGLHVRAFAGHDATAHVEQLQHIDATLLGRLRERWDS